VDEKTAKEFLAKLDVEAGELAKKGMLAEGRVLQQEIAQIKRLYLTESKKTTSDATPPQEDPVAACEKAIRQRQIDLQLQYSGELEALEKASQAKGALEDMFAVKAERQRYLETPILAKSNLVETPSSLRELQGKYLDLQEGLAAKVAEGFVERLEQQKQSLTIEGKLEAALQAKRYAETISQRYLGQGLRRHSQKSAPNVEGTWNSNGSHFTIRQQGGVLVWTSQDLQHTYTAECKWTGSNFVGTCTRTIKGSGCTVPIKLVLTLKSPTQIVCEDTATQTGCGLTRNQQHTSTWNKVE
jgi:hypothetical protein